MNQHDIIRMARAADAYADKLLSPGEYHPDRHDVRDAKFAELSASHERNEILTILWDYAGREDISDSDQSLLKHLVDLIRARSE